MARVYIPRTLTSLQMGNLRLREINNLPRVTQQVSGKTGV